MEKRRYYRLSVTTLEKFRRYMADTSSGDTEQALMESLRGLFKGNDKTKIGTAFHGLIEEPEKAYPFRWQGADYIVSKGIAFPVQAANLALVYKEQHQRMFMEIPVGKMYHSLLASVYMSGRCDGIEGATVRDTKVKFRQHGGDYKAVQDYMDSVQWKGYLDITGARRFYFDVFEVKSYDTWPGYTQVKRNPGDWTEIAFLEGIEMEAHQDIECVAYERMNEDIGILINEFLEWIEFRGLQHLLTPCDANGFKLPKEVPPAR